MCVGNWHAPKESGATQAVSLAQAEDCCENQCYWVVVSNMFYFHPYLGKITILTNIQMGWFNHQPG